MIDYTKEQMLTFGEATKVIPPIRRGKKPHKSTVDRWARKGRKGIKLETLDIGGTPMTSVEALGRFFERLGNDQPILKDPKVSDAEAKLKQLGF